MKRNLLTAALLLSVALALTLVHISLIDRPTLEPRMQLHGEIVNGTAISPYRYRVLVPFAAEGLIRVLEGAFGLARWQAFLWGYAAIEGGLILLLLASVFLFLRQWLAWGQSIVGVLALAVVFPLTILEQYFQPWSYLETSLLALTLLAARSRHRVLLGAICVLLATLNRESGLVAAFGFFLVTFDFERLFAGLRQRRLDIDWRGVLLGAMVLLIWAAAFFGLRVWRGYAPQIHSLAQLWAMNTQPKALFTALLNWLAFSGLLWVLGLAGLRTAPVFFRRLAWVIPLYLALILVWGVWSEVRLLMPLYVVLLVPAILYVDRLVGAKEAAQ